MAHGHRPISLKRHAAFQRSKERTMPVLLWLLGVPISLIILLMLFGAV
jgi:CHASE1-domain containing sensor protein